jgi:hypothetical protein
MVGIYKDPSIPQRTEKARAQHARNTALRWDRVIAALNELGIRPGPDGKVPRGTLKKVQAHLDGKFKISDPAVYKILQRLWL